MDTSAINVVTIAVFTFLAAASFRKFVCRMSIVEIDGLAANFSDAYLDDTSIEYSNLSKDVCLAVSIHDRV